MPLARSANTRNVPNLHSSQPNTGRSVGLGISPPLPPITPRISQLREEPSTQLNSQASLWAQGRAGHEALAEASHWLVAHDGRRMIDSENVDKASAGGELTARSLKSMTAPARRLVAASGAITAREVRKAGKEDISLLQPLTKEEKEMKRVLELISEKASQKFSTVREAMRHLDADLTGTVDRSEVRYFFRGYDFSDDVADRFFDFLDRERKEELDYPQFVNFLRPYLQGAVNGNPLGARSLTNQAGQLDAITAKNTTQVSLEEVWLQHHEMLKLIGSKARDRFGNLQQAFRYVDGDKTGTITRSEMHYFFRVFNLPETVADGFFDIMDAGRTGLVKYKEFEMCLRPYLEPDKVVKTRRVTKAETPMPGDSLPPTAPPSAEGFRPRPLAEPQPKAAIQMSTDSLVQSLQPGDSGYVNAEIRAELRSLMQDIGQKLPLKFKHARDAFRPLDLQRNGMINKNEMRAFFRGFGQPQDVADRVFDLIDDQDLGQIEFDAFMRHFDAVLGPAFRSAKRQPLIPVEDPSLAKEVNDIADVILTRLATKYRNVQEAFRALDLNKDGKVSLHEMKVFIKQFNLPAGSADKFFQACDTDGSGFIAYSEFVQLFAYKG
eukprot:TRINITY_DN87846_c0_g1_i1.p1 TRINITY_DN87846_c0_g1~~TRINITY_DN87846_c0_g1_i1.p1  ORF type:complete len:630 (-),score=141.64 TRINITY_DN87846_c0_g1_i1:37-1860(-)